MLRLLLARTWRMLRMLLAGTWRIVRRIAGRTWHVARRIAARTRRDLRMLAALARRALRTLAAGTGRDLRVLATRTGRALRMLAARAWRVLRRLAARTWRAGRHLAAGAGKQLRRTPERGRIASLMTSFGASPQRPVPGPRRPAQPRQPVPRQPAPPVRAIQAAPAARPRIQPPAEPAAAPPRLRPSTLAAMAAWTVAGIALFTCYLHASRTAAVNSDGASNALQAWDMLHGNPLLRGWQLSDVSFYTTELPQYAVIEKFRGLGPDVVHIAGAMTYTLVVMLAALLAKGRATGTEGITRSVIAAGIMLAPQLGTGIYVLLLSSDHVGSAVPVLLLWLVLDRVKQRWIAPIAVLIALTWAMVADGIVLYTAALPVFGVCCVRAYQARLDGRPWRVVLAEVATAAAALTAAWLGGLILRQIAAAGGFRVWPVGSMLTSFGQLPHNVMITIHGLLVLFGADFFSQSVGLVSILAALHLAGLGLAAWAGCSALRRFGRCDLAVQLLAAAVAVGLAAYLLGTRATDLNSSRDIAAVLPSGAALAGRLLAGRLAAARLVPALALVLAGYLLSLGRVIAQPPVPAQDTQLVTWLENHNLQSGLGGYWDGNVVTLDSAGKVRLSPVLANGQLITPGYWEVNRAWYDPAKSTANFVVLVTPPATLRYPTGLSIRDTFGQPATINYVGRYTVLVWTKNLLADIAPAGPPPAPGPVQAPPGAAAPAFSTGR